MGDTRVPTRQDWCFGEYNKSIFDNKERIIKSYMTRFFNRLNQMFEYEGLPETIPKKDYLFAKQMIGYNVIVNVDNKYYQTYGTLGGKLDVNYLPTEVTIANPYIPLSKTLKVDEECVVILNDSMYEGCYTINRLYAELLTECDITMRSALINKRMDNTFESSNDTTDTSITKFMEDVVQGKLSHIVSKSFMDDTTLRVHQLAKQGDNFSALIEVKNFIDSCWYLEFGINAMYNMKREKLSSGETEIDSDTLIPFVQDMYEEEKKGWERVNKLWGLNVQVHLSSVWKKIYDSVLNPNKEPDNDKIEGGDSNDEKDE